MDTATSEVEEIVERFRQGQLTEDELRDALGARQHAPRHQDLLYMEVSSTGLTSSVLGMNLVCHGQVVDPAVPSPEWGYANVLDALRDGWRIIKFPELALMMIEERNVGLGCEFVLEKLS